jgi:hypothetical protein
MTQDVTIRKLEDIPNTIEQFIMDQVVDYLKKYLFGPILQAVEDAKEVNLHYQLHILTKLTTFKLASKAIAKMTDFFNMAGSEVVAVMTDLGHVVPTEHYRLEILLISQIVHRDHHRCTFYHSRLHPRRSCRRRLHCSTPRNSFGTHFSWRNHGFPLDATSTIEHFITVI